MVVHADVGAELSVKHAGAAAGRQRARSTFTCHGSPSSFGLSCCSSRILGGYAHGR